MIDDSELYKYFDEIIEAKSNPFSISKKEVYNPILFHCRHIFDKTECLVMYFLVNQPLKKKDVLKI